MEILFFGQGNYYYYYYYFGQGISSRIVYCNTYVTTYKRQIAQTFAQKT